MNRDFRKDCYRQENARNADISSLWRDGRQTLDPSFLEIKPTHPTIFEEHIQDLLFVAPFYTEPEKVVRARFTTQLSLFPEVIAPKRWPKL